MTTNKNELTLLIEPELQTLIDKAKSLSMIVCDKEAVAHFEGKKINYSSAAYMAIDLTI